ncbi:hypothetical protein RUM43_006192 [Polyplax serrata]|uniref:Uncharacterized protein n=1 Tax=Polyplax serrata TaxID=468196 RepID=A0AAN8NSS2_POLSC
MARVEGVAWGFGEMVSGAKTSVENDVKNRRAEIERAEFGECGQDVRSDLSSRFPGPRQAMNPHVDGYSMESTSPGNGRQSRGAPINSDRFR